MANSSVIRRLFEEGVELAAVVGRENVYDYSLGNPSVAPPKIVKESILQILETKDANYIHGYMNNSGYEEVRDAVAESLNKRFGTDFVRESIIMTAGAAGALNCILRTLLNYKDEVICFAPFFGEYRSYISNFGGETVVVPANTETFQLNLDVLDSYITEKTKAVIVNNPNNPSGAVYSAQTLSRLNDILTKAQERIGHPIYVISDEPYRELVYDGAHVPFMTKYVKNCLVCYSFSKSLSLPGERIGYLAIPKQIDAYEEMQSALVVANRCLGFINAPSLFQLVAKECLYEETDIETYDKNRMLLYNGLTEMGFECVKPQGAFYLFVKSPVPDEKAFVQEAKKHNLILVSASSFGCPGYVRLAYCVSYDMIKRSLPAFKKLAQTYWPQDTGAAAHGGAQGQENTAGENCAAGQADTAMHDGAAECGKERENG